MAKIAMLLPYADMLNPAAQAASLYNLNLVSLSVISPETIPAAIPSVLEQQADIIIARGLNAQKIRSLVHIPVVEIKITSYEISLLVQKAKTALPPSLQVPRIVILGPGDIFSPLDIPDFNQQHHVELELIPYQSRNECDQISRTLIQEKKADVLIGASPTEEIQAEAQEAEILWMERKSNVQGILDACRIAQALSSALDVEKEHAASLKLLLNRAASGIIQLDSSGHVVQVNSFVEHLLFMDASSIKNRPIWRFIPGITETMLRMVLEKKKELHAVPVRYGQSEFVVHITPIIVENKSSGAIISFHEGRQIEAIEEKKRRELLCQGYSASHTFDRMISRSPQMRELCTQARHFASFQFPVLIMGDSGTEKQYLAECIHNASSFKNQPFFRFNCNGYEPKVTERILFDRLINGTETSDDHSVYNGPCTLYLREVSSLSLQAQFQLLQLIQDNATTVGSPGGNTCQNRFRVIMSTKYSLPELIRQGKFRRDLYYLISIATLQIPPLSQRREDIMGWVDYQMQSLSETYGRYIKFTKDAQKYLTDYNWPGNIIELRAVCNRLMINCKKYFIDAADIEEQIRILTGSIPQEPARSFALNDIYNTALSPRQQILDALSLHRGNREATAAELQISTSTLWRRMKQYRIPKNAGKET